MTHTLSSRPKAARRAFLLMVWGAENSAQRIFLMLRSRVQTSTRPFRRRMAAQTVMTTPTCQEKCAKGAAVAERSASAFLSVIPVGNLLLFYSVVSTGAWSGSAHAKRRGPLFADSLPCRLANSLLLLFFLLFPRVAHVSILRRGIASTAAPYPCVGIPRKSMLHRACERVGHACERVSWPGYRFDQVEHGFGCRIKINDKPFLSFLNVQGSRGVQKAEAGWGIHNLADAADARAFSL